MHLIIALAIRCLPSFSDYSNSSSYTPFLFSSNSPRKAIWLWLLVEVGFIWNFSYLGHYADFNYAEETRTVHNEEADIIWAFTSEKTGDEVEDKMYSPYSPIFLPWQDVVVRLSYIHLVDNLIPVIWLWHFLEQRTLCTSIIPSSLRYRCS